MPKINYHRGETRESLAKHNVDKTWARKRHRLYGRTKYRTSRGLGGLMRDYRGLFTDVALRGWCPCCIGWMWRKDLRSTTGRVAGRLLVHRALRRDGRSICRGELALWLEDSDGD